MGVAQSPTLATAPAQDVEHAAVMVRRAVASKGAKSGKKARGRTTTEDERALAALLEKKLHALGLHAAKVTAVATKPGQGGDLRFEHIPGAKMDLLKQAIGRRTLGGAPRLLRDSDRVTR